MHSSAASGARSHLDSSSIMSAASLNPNSPRRVMLQGGRVGGQCGSPAEHTDFMPLDCTAVACTAAACTVHIQCSKRLHPLGQVLGLAGAGGRGVKHLGVRQLLLHCGKVARGGEVAVAEWSGWGQEAPASSDRQHLNEKQPTFFKPGCVHNRPHLDLHHRLGGLGGLRPLVGQQVLGLVALGGRNAEAAAHGVKLSGPVGAARWQMRQQCVWTTHTPAGQPDPSSCLVKHQQRRRIRALEPAHNLGQAAGGGHPAEATQDGK